MVRTILTLFIVIFLCSSLVSITYAADDFKRWNSPRDYEPVNLKGNDFAEFLGDSISYIFAYSYNSLEDKWIQIPLQIDERDDSSHVWIPSPNKILDANDEIIFMARDMGDEASEPYIWLDDADSRNNVRYKITATDVNSGNQQAWVYFYLSSTLQDTVSTAYMNYTVAPSGTGADIIAGVSYVEGHNNGGIPDYWEIPVVAGGNGVDLLDRQKARVTSAVIGFPIDMTEENLTNPDIEYVVGKVRVARRIWYIVELFGYPITQVDIPMYYYPYSIDSKGASGTLSADYKVDHIRQSFDLNSNASGMHFYNNFNSDILIDGSPETINTSLVFNPDVNWYMFTGDQGTIFTLTKLDPLGNDRLYYYDNSGGGTGDGKLDTGDMKSWGDVGILITGTALEGRFSIAFVTYFLSKNQLAAIGPDYADNYKLPLTVSENSEGYQPPTEVALSLPDTSAPEQSVIQVPISVGDVTGLNITSVQISLTYDTSILDALGVTNEGTISSAWGTPILTKQTDGIDIDLSGTAPLSGSGTLALIEFHVTGDDGQSTALHFVNVVFSAGNVIATTTDGSILVEPGEVAISLPDTTGMSGTSIRIPVTVSDVTGLDILSVNIMISYDPLILDAVSISTANTIASSWPAPTFNDFNNRAHIIMNGSLPLAGEGILVYIDFNIKGPDTATSLLHFITAIFNSGSPIALKNDGSFTVEGVIPVELASFDAHVSKGDVRLNWTTASESNNYGFEVHRKSKHDMSWEKVGFVKGHGTTTIPHGYSFIDRYLTTGTYFYRLKQIDFNGSFEFSKLVEVTISAPSTFSLEQNYPNPFNLVTKINYQIPEVTSGNVTVNLTIYNLLGTKVKTLISKQQSPGFYTIFWDGRDNSGSIVPTGTYIYRLRAASYVATKRMVLIK